MLFIIQAKPPASNIEAGGFIIKLKNDGYAVFLTNLSNSLPALISIFNVI